MRSVSLVLGSGGARGLSFIGALKVLEKEDISISSVVGTSMGAIIGGAYCAGRTASEIEVDARKLKASFFMQWGLTGSALFSNRRAGKSIERIVSKDKFEDLIIPLTVVASDLEQGVPVTFKSGALIPPITGSSLAAGIFEPVYYEGMHLVDGGHTQPIPLQYADVDSIPIVMDPMVRPDWPIGIPVKKKFSNIFNLKLAYRQFLKGIDASLFYLSQEEVRKRDCVHVIPELAGMAFSDFSKAEFAIEAGAKAMEAMMPEIKKRIEAK